MSSHPNLTQKEAERRARRVRDPRYRLELQLSGDEPVYQGRCRIRFELEKAEAIHLDYQGREVLELKVNRKKVPASVFKRNRIQLPKKHLKKGRNSVEVRFASVYDNDGAGLHRAVDPADGRAYLYTVFSPFDANRVLPCFDQPDLKGRLELTVRAPAEWTVLSATPLLESFDEGGQRVHVFSETPPLSTYLFNLCAGPWACWRDPEARVPSRIFAAQSMRKYVDTEELFRITRQGFDFYERYFEISYPFEKYDQVFCPHFNWGAMENVGCVLHSDNMLFRHRATLRERIDRADTIVHELSHMWFGNLATMVWWNDLWLNESFATYMANLCLAEGTDYGEQAWEHFALDIKEWAYWQDELCTTHPIETAVPDTDTTFTNFDGITYGKGAATLKQLAFYLGPETFRRGVSRYLKEHSFGNARCEDFLECLGAEAGLDLDGWERVWLKTSGVNEIRPRLVVERGKVKEFWIDQEAGNGDAALRPHRLKVLLLDEGKGKRPIQGHISEVEIQGPHTRIAELEGIPAPAMVYANHEDHAYAKVLLDERSLRYVGRKLDRLRSPLLRSGIWAAAWHMVRDGRTPPETFAELFLREAGPEPEAALVHNAWTDLRTTLQRYLPEEAGKRYGRRLEKLAWTQLEAAEPRSDLQSTWFEVALGATASKPGLERVEALLDGEDRLDGLVLDQEKRWALVTRLAGAGYRRGPILIEHELERDGSERGHQAAFQARVSLPDPVEKEQAWVRFQEDRESPLGLLRAGMRGFWWAGQRELLRPYAARYFEALDAVSKGRGGFFLNAFVPTLYPRPVVEQGVLRRTRNYLKKNSGATRALTRPLEEEADELARALRIQRGGRR